VTIVYAMFGATRSPVPRSRQRRLRYLAGTASNAVSMLQLMEV